MGRSLCGAAVTALRACWWSGRTMSSSKTCTVSSVPMRLKPWTSRRDRAWRAWRLAARCSCASRSNARKRSCLSVPAHIEHREMKHVRAVEIDGLRVGASRRIALAHEIVQSGIASRPMGYVERDRARFHGALRRNRCPFAGVDVYYRALVRWRARAARRRPSFTR
jgi:hypothetical protein